MDWVDRCSVMWLESKSSDAEAVCIGPTMDLTKLGKVTVFGHTGGLKLKRDVRQSPPAPPSLAASHLVQHSHRIMSLLPLHLKLNETHNILICPVHECVVLLDSVKKHFDKHHSKDLTPAKRTQLQQESDELSISIQLKTDYSQFQFTNTDGTPLHEIPYLGLHSSLQCNICEYICSKKSADKTMKDHLRTVHKISVGAEPRGLYSLSQHVRSITSQRYFIGVTREAEGLNVLRHFEVIPSDTVSDSDRIESHGEPSTDRATPPTSREIRPDVNEDSNISVVSRLQAQLDKAKSWARKERENRLATIPHDQSVQTNPWLAYTRFLEILLDNWDDALKYMAIPTRETELALYLVYSTTKSMVRTWQNSTAKTSRYARIRVMQEDSNDVPLLLLETYQNFSLQHALPLQKIFVFFYRVIEEGRHALSQLHLSTLQKEAWGRIAEHLHITAGAYPEVEASYTRTHMDTLKQLCYEFWLALIEQTSLDDDFELAFVVATAFLVVSKEGKSVREVYNFAIDITALKKMVRLASIQKFREHFVEPMRTQDIGNTDSVVT